MRKNDSWLKRKIELPFLEHPESEKENTWTHLIGVLFSLISLFYIILKLSIIETLPIKIGLLIYCLTMILLYSASTLYHYLPIGDAKRFFRVLDHSNIYLLIAGTYTPVLLYVNSSKANLVCILIWIIALFGIIFSLFFLGRLKPLHSFLYVLMGWFIVFFWNDIVTQLPSGLLAFILYGGIFYTVGVVFYSLKKLPHFHAIWHIFVLAGTIFHFVGFAKYLM